MRHLLLFFCAILSTPLIAQIEVSVSNNRIFLRSLATGETWQSYDTNPIYNQLPYALNSVNQWEPSSYPIDVNPELISNIYIYWVQFSIGSYSAYPVTCPAAYMEEEPNGDVCITPDNFINELLSLDGGYQQIGDTFILTNCDVPGNCDCLGNILDECGVCGGDNSSCSGCTDSSACNYDSMATQDDGTCEFNNDDCGVCGGDNSSCSGCTHENATNYDSTATIEDGSCMYNQEAFDAGYEAGVASVECPPCANSDCPGDFTADGYIGVDDILSMLSLYDTSCSE